MLEQKYRSGFVDRTHSAFPLGMLRELKYCTLCGKLFFRKVKLHMDSDGVLRNVADTICIKCHRLSKPPLVLPPRSEVEREIIKPIRFKKHIIVKSSMCKKEDGTGHQHCRVIFCQCSCHFSKTDHTQ